MALVVSVVNHKGGVGKTTTVVALGEFLAWRGRRVLLVDLDAQGSATAALVRPRLSADRDAVGLTVAQVFRDRLSGEHRFHPDLAILRSVSNVAGGLPGLDLLPASPQLSDVQDRLAFIPPAGFLGPGPARVLAQALASVVDQYDYVLVDCPPNLGLLTLNGLAAAHAYLVPVVPDVFSTCGLPDMLSRVSALLDLRLLGVLVCKYRSQSTLHRATIDGLRARRDLPLFAAVVPESSQVAEAADFGDRPRTLKQKYRPAGIYAVFDALTDEFVARATAAVGRAG